MSRNLILTLAFTSFASIAQANDWPQWLGPKRDGVWSDTGILDKFPAEGPKVLWRKPISSGYAGPAVADGRVYVADRELAKGAMNPTDPFDNKTVVKSTERVLCFDAKTGQELWKHEYECPYHISYPSGPRARPRSTMERSMPWARWAISFASMPGPANPSGRRTSPRITPPPFRPGASAATHSFTRTW